MNKNKILEWVYRVVCFIIIDSLITVVTFSGLHYTITILTEMDKLLFGSGLVILLASVGSLYLQVANFIYWFFDDNIMKVDFIRKPKQEGTK